MSLKACPDCGKQISSSAQTCPSCGRRFSTFAGLALFLLVALLLLSGYILRTR